MTTTNLFWLIDSDTISRMKRVNTSNWDVKEVINDRFFVVRGVCRYDVERAGYSTINIYPIGSTDLQAVQYLNSTFNTSSWYWLNK